MTLIKINFKSSWAPLSHPELLLVILSSSKDELVGHPELLLVILSPSKDEPVGHPELLLVILSSSKDELVGHPELVEGWTRRSSWACRRM